MEIEELRFCVKESAFELSQAEEVILLAKFTKIMDQIRLYESQWEKNKGKTDLDEAGLKKEFRTPILTKEKDLDYDKDLMKAALHQRETYVHI